MKKIFITGSNDGLGLMAAERLLDLGHEVLLHARNKAKADLLRQRLPEPQTTPPCKTASCNFAKKRQA